MVGVYVGFMTVLGGVFSVIDTLTGEVLGALAGQTIAMTLAAVATLLLARPILSLNWRAAILRAGGRVRGGVWVAVAVLFAVGYPLVVQIAMLTHLVLPMPEFVARLFDELFDTRGQELAAFVLLTVLAPLVEEFVCRGWLMPAVLEKWRPAWAIVFTALVFALMHLNPWQFFYAMYLGAWLGWIFVRTRSVWPCVVGHAVSNGLSWAWSVLDQGESGPTHSYLDPPELLPWPIAGLSLVAVIACAFWLHRTTSGKATARLPQPLNSLN